MIHVDRGLADARPLLLPHAQRLERLAKDLRGIADGGIPQPRDLESCPVLDQWRLAARAIITMAGVGQGHPRLPDGPLHTTEIVAIDLERRWARTLSRFYVLGDAYDGDRGHGR